MTPKTLRMLQAPSTPEASQTMSQQARDNLPRQRKKREGKMKSFKCDR